VRLAGSVHRLALERWTRPALAQERRFAADLDPRRRGEPPRESTRRSGWLAHARPRSRVGAAIVGGGPTRYAPGMQELCSEYTDPTGARGYVVQGYDPDTATYTMIDALLTETRWLPTEPPMVPGQGTPAFAYMTMRLMKVFKIPPGSLRRLVVGGNHHVESVLQLARMEREGVALDEAVGETMSGQSATTPMIQSYHQVVAVRLHGGKRDTLASLLDWHVRGGSERRRALARDRSDEHAAALARFGASPDDVVLYDYETHYDLAPHPALAQLRRG
jgi:hypothetical protein